LLFSRVLKNKIQKKLIFQNPKKLPLQFIHLSVAFVSNLLGDEVERKKSNEELKIHSIDVFPISD